VPESKKALEPSERYAETASVSARELGAAVNVSPAQIDYMVRGIFGQIGLYAIGASDVVLRAALDYPVAPEKNIGQYPIIRRFVHDEDNPNNKWVTEFYDQLEKSRQADATLKMIAGERTEKEAEAYAARRPEHEFAKDLGREARGMGKIRKEITEIRKDREMSAAEKRVEINARNAELRERAKQAVIHIRGE
jgi:hypothetical protein